MELRIDQLSKRYTNQWVFRDLSAHINSGTHVAISGPNGSGKSTLLKILSGALYPTTGTITYFSRDKKIPLDTIFSEISFAAPYADMIEEMTLREAIRFHLRYRAFVPELGGVDGFLEHLTFDFPTDQQIQVMSSGMKQRLRLAFALFTQASLTLLDEPTVTLDTTGIVWFKDILQRFAGARTLIIASNVDADLFTCTDRIELERSEWNR